MNNSNVTIRFNHETPTIINKNHTNDTYLSYVAKVKWNPSAKKLAPVDSCYTFIRIPEALKKILPDKYYTLVNLSNGTFIDAIIDYSKASNPEYIDVTKFISDSLKLTSDSELVICKQNHCHINALKIQTFGNIKEDVLALSDKSPIVEMVKDFFLFEVINPLTNDSIFIRSKHIVFDDTLEKGEIRLNRKQRNMLSDNIPTRLSTSQWNGLMECVQDQKIKDDISAVYTEDGKGRTINQSVEDIDFQVKLSLQQYLKIKFGETLIVRPVLESFHYEKKNKLLRRLCDFYVGKSTLSLNCRRPHECDENYDVVRMSENNMLLLGIEPMDKVILRYKETEVSCHVLPFHEDKFGRTNIPSIIELSIGIPAHIRNQLRMADIQSSVKVDRDTAFIFKKDFNDQLVPIILTLLSLNFFEKLTWYASTALVLVLIPIVMYLTLSSKRNLRAK